MRLGFFFRSFTILAVFGWPAWAHIETDFFDPQDQLRENPSLVYYTPDGTNIYRTVRNPSDPNNPEFKSGPLPVGFLRDSLASELKEDFFARAAKVSNLRSRVKELGSQIAESKASEIADILSKQIATHERLLKAAEEQLGQEQVLLQIAEQKAIQSVALVEKVITAIKAKTPVYVMEKGDYAGLLPDWNPLVKNLNDTFHQFKAFTPKMNPNGLLPCGVPGTSLAERAKHCLVLNPTKASRKFNGSWSLVEVTPLGVEFWWGKGFAKYTAEFVVAAPKITHAGFRLYDEECARYQSRRDGIYGTVFTDLAKPVNLPVQNMKEGVWAQFILDYGNLFYSRVAAPETYKRSDGSSYTIDTHHVNFWTSSLGHRSYEVSGTQLVEVEEQIPVQRTTGTAQVTQSAPNVQDVSWLSDSYPAVKTIKKMAERPVTTTHSESGRYMFKLDNYDTKNRGAASLSIPYMFYSEVEPTHSYSSGWLACLAQVAN